MQALEHETFAVPDNEDSQAHLLGISTELCLSIYVYVFGDLLLGSTGIAATSAQVGDSLQPTILQVCPILGKEAKAKFRELLGATVRA